MEVHLWCMTVPGWTPTMQCTSLYFAALTRSFEAPLPSRAFTDDALEGGRETGNSDLTNSNYFECTVRNGGKRGSNVLSKAGVLYFEA